MSEGKPAAVKPENAAAPAGKTEKKDKPRRGRKKQVSILLAILAAAILFWYLNIEIIQRNSCSVSSGKIKNDVTIALISDLHGKSFGIHNRRLIAAIRKTKPDVVAVVGDMFTKGNRQGEKTALSLLETLAEEFPVYYVPGEHEHGTVSFFESLRDAGVHVLDYRAETAKINGNEICFYGITNVYYSPTFDLANEFTIDPSVYNVLLAHIPNTDAFERFGCDLVLCGDTHGGQVRLPFLGAITDGSAFFPELSGAREKGLYPFEDGSGAMYVTSGLGNYPIPVRLFNLPEVAVITLCGE